jgi:hypothetical protein
MSEMRKKFDSLYFEKKRLKLANSIDLLQKSENTLKPSASIGVASARYLRLLYDSKISARGLITYNFNCYCGSHLILIPKINIFTKLRNQRAIAKATIVNISIALCGEKIAKC